MTSPLTLASYLNETLQDVALTIVVAEILERAAFALINPPIDDQILEFLGVVVVLLEIVFLLLPWVLLSFLLPCLVGGKCFSGLCKGELRVSGYRLPSDAKEEMNAIEAELVEEPDHEIAGWQLDLVVDVVFFFGGIPVGQVERQLSEA